MQEEIRELREENRVIQPAYDQAMSVASYNLEDWKQMEKEGVAAAKAKIDTNGTTVPAIPDIRDPAIRDARNEIAHGRMLPRISW